VFSAAGGTAASGKEFQIATGSRFTAVSGFTTARFTSETVITYADRNRPSILRGVDVRGSKHLHFKYLLTNGTAAPHYFLLKDGSLNLCENITLTECNRDGAGFINNQFLACRGVQDLTVNDSTVPDMQSLLIDYTNADSIIRGVFNRCIVPGFRTDGSIFSKCDGPLTFNDCVFLKPMRITGATTHLDGWQVNDGASSTLTVNMNRCMFIQANGDAGCQGFFMGGTGSVQIVMDGFVYVGRAPNAIQIAKNRDSSLKRITIWQTSSGPVNTTSTENDAPTDAPNLALRGTSGTVTGANTLDRALVYGQLQVDAAISSFWTVGDGVVAFNASVASPPAASAYFDNPPKATLDGFDYDNATYAEIIAAVKAALSPKVDGSAKRGDGSYDGAFNPDGSWATDAAYVP
jgi:hypothetical protein